MNRDRPTLPLSAIVRHRLTRRAALARLAGAGAAAMAAAGLEWSQAAAQQATPAASPAAGFTAGADLVEPPVRASQNGKLDVTLTARVGDATVAGQPVKAWVYDGAFPSSTLRIQNGDTVRIKVVNELSEMTNFHTHGFHVSPGGNSDNIFVMIPPGESFQYEYHIPTNHSPGLYWYHPHPHGISANQVAGGLAGVIVNEGEIDQLPGIAGLTERLLIIQATQFGPDGMVVPAGQQSAATQLHLINGQLKPVIRMRPGETQRWRIANISADNFYNLALASHPLNQIAGDANPFDSVQPTNALLLGPGERSEVLVQAVTSPGTYEFRSLLWGGEFQAMPDMLLATVIIEGEPVAPTPLPTTLIPFEDLSQLQVDRQRHLTFQIMGSPSRFQIDGQMFDPDRVDQTVPLNALEEWVIHNTSEDWHPFHIHVNDFQVVAINGEPYTAHGYDDTYLVPPYGSIAMRTRFLDFKGKFVYHCHILSHEDHGMMGVVDVV